MLLPGRLGGYFLQSGMGDDSIGCEMGVAGSGAGTGSQAGAGHVRLDGLCAADAGRHERHFQDDSAERLVMGPVFQMHKSYGADGMRLMTHNIDQAIFMAHHVPVFSARPDRIKTRPAFMDLKARLTEVIRAECSAADLR